MTYEEMTEEQKKAFEDSRKPSFEELQRIKLSEIQALKYSNIECNDGFFSTTKSARGKLNDKINFAEDGIKIQWSESGGKVDTYEKQSLINLVKTIILRDDKLYIKKKEVEACTTKTALNKIKV